jgi:RNA polymerase sigma-70 factor (ECF subfamily)
MDPDQPTNIDGKESLRMLARFEDAEFEQFFKRYFVPLCTYCQTRFGFELELAKDTVQGTFLRLWENRHALPADIDLKSYFYRMVSNACLDLLRHDQVKQKFVKHILSTREDSEIDSFANTDLKSLSAEIDQCVKELPEQMRRVFELVRFEGNKYSEAAAKLGISEKTVENQMGRALARLRDKLSKYMLLALLMMLAMAMLREFYFFL